MTRGWIKLAVLTVSLASIFGMCCHLYGDERIKEMLKCKCGSKCGSKCTLLPQVLAERKITLEASLGLKTLERTELDDGIAIRFPTDSQTIRDVFDFVIFERSCCSFVTFELILNSGDGPFWLRLRGDREAKKFLKDMFDVPDRPTISGSPPG